MATVRIPPTLRPEAGGHREVEVNGDTVREALDALVEIFPGLAGPLLDKGRIQAFVNVYLDGTDVRALNGLDTPLEQHATLLLLPAMAGGSRPPGAGTGRPPPANALEPGIRLASDVCTDRSVRVRIRVSAPYTTGERRD
ncbi:MAG: MoaD/ThiS family protein [Thermoleophilaceae bacterium]